MNKPNLILASTLAIIFTSILIIFSPNSQKLSLSSPAPSPVLTESISPTPDPTADWKTYENKEYGFSLEIPNYLVTKSRPNFPWQIDFWNESDDTTGYYKYYLNPLGDPQNYKTPLFWVFIDGNSMKALQGDDGNGPQELRYIKPINENFGLFYSGVVLHNQVCATEKNNKTIMVECSDKNLSDPLFNQILSTFKFTDNTAVIPSSITTFYTAVNSYFKSSIAIVPEKQFYSSQGMIDKASWSLDISKVDKEKGLISNVFMNQFNMKTGPGGGDRGGASIIEFVNDKLDCYYSTGSNSTGGPETWNYSNSYSNISCTEK